MIKNLVLSGGDIAFLSMLGSLNKIKDKIKDIENIYSVSCGSWVGFFLSLKLDMQEIINYFIERPWFKLFNFNADKIFNLYNSLGIYDISIFYKIFEPLLKLCNLNNDITMIELYNYSNIKLNIYATKYDDLSIKCFNHELTPDMKVIEAIFLSSSIPILFEPLKYNGEYYIDGGYNCNFPLHLCLEEHSNEDEILGINIEHYKDETSADDNDNILSFYLKLFYKFIVNKRCSYKKDNNVKKIIIYSNILTMDKFLSIINDKKVREEYVLNGEKSANLFLEYN
tara:strand:- start:3754 stop:4602 length:849 start_codon:yes stop_codon:yes gene_type:complete